VSTENGKREVIGLIGLGVDNNDGHQRVTRAQDILLLGGSQDTHAAMQRLILKFGESLRRRGKGLRDASVEEVIELLHDARNG
jgi:hypothetical protein